MQTPETEAVNHSALLLAWVQSAGYEPGSRVFELALARSRAALDLVPPREGREIFAACHAAGVRAYAQSTLAKRRAQIATCLKMLGA